LGIAGRYPCQTKVAARDFASGDHITMYGVTIGRAKQSTAAGSLLTQGNFAHDTDGFAGKQHDYTWTAPNVST
jgi:altronate hydrolase